MKNKRHIVWLTIMLVLVSSLAYGQPERTFSLANNVDDTFSTTRDVDTNEYIHEFVIFGRFDFSLLEQDFNAYYRWPLDIPRASKITASNLSQTAGAEDPLSFTSQIWRLIPDTAWEDAGGFNDTNYPLGSDLDSISTGTISTPYAPPSWVVDLVYDATMTTVLQEAVDALADYNPLSQPYVGIKIDDGNGSYTSQPWPWRRTYSYDNVPAKSTELDVTFEPWAEIRTGNGMKYDTDCNCYRYFDY